MAKEKKEKEVKPTLTKEEKQKIKRLETIKANIEEATERVNTLLNKYTDSCIIIQDEKELSDYIDTAIKNGEISIDTETTGLNTFRDKIVGICIYTYGKSEAYIPVNHVNYETEERINTQLNIDVVAKYLNKLKNTRVIMHNSDFDIRMLRRIGVNLSCYWDTLIMAHLLNENEEHGLKKLHSKYILKGKEDEFSFGKLFSFKDITFADIPINIAAIYAAHDAKITQELKDFQYGVMQIPRDDIQAIYKLFREIEMPCLEAIIDMEETGFAFNIEYHKIIAEKYHTLLNDEEKKLYDKLNEYSDIITEWRNSEEANAKEQKKNKDGTLKFNAKGEPEYAKSKNEQLTDPITLSSPTQLAILLYDILKIDPPLPETPRSTGEEALQAINNDFTKMLLNYRHFSKMVDAFVDALPKQLEADNRIHCSLNQLGAKTGRMSCSDPNLQQIPSDSDDIRRFFMAPVNYRDVESDNIFRFKDTEEIEVEPDNWIFVKNLKIGDKIQDSIITNIHKENNYIIIEIR